MMDTGIYCKSDWMDIWDRAYYSKAIAELEERRALWTSFPDDEWNREKIRLMTDEIEEYKPILAELRRKLKPQMQKRMIRGGARP